MKIKITQRILDELEKHRIYFRPHFHYGDALGKVIPVINEVEAEPYSRIPEASLTWNDSVSIGAFSYVVQGSRLEGSRIGRYCSIGTGVKIMGQSHPTDRVTTSTWTYGHNIKKLIEQDFGVSVRQNYQVPNESGLNIGHDVWIAENVTFKRNLTIGNGAIVAANSVVTKDIPPYAIVAGNPAKIIRFRFSESQIATLLETRWWNKSPKLLAEKNLTNIDEFLNSANNLIEYQDFEYKKVNLNSLAKDISESTDDY